MLTRVTVLVVIWAGLVGLFIGVGEAITHSAAVTSFDRQATRDAVTERTAALNTAMKVVTWLGSWVALLAAAAIVVLLVVVKRLPVLAIAVAVGAWAGEALGVHIVKATIDRHRPPQAIWLVQAHGWSFPSGHAATATVAFTTLAVCVVMLARALIVRIAAWLTAVLGIAATAFSRVLLGVHWTTDVIAGVVFVASWLAAVAVLVGGLAVRREP